MNGQMKNLYQVGWMTNKAKAQYPWDTSSNIKLWQISCNGQEKDKFCV